MNKIYNFFQVKEKLSTIITGEQIFSTGTGGYTITIPMFKKPTIMFIVNINALIDHTRYPIFAIQNTAGSLELIYQSNDSIEYDSENHQIIYRRVMENSNPPSSHIIYYAVINNT